MNLRRVFLFGAIITLLIPVALWRILTPLNQDSNEYQRVRVQIAGVTVTADISDTEQLRQRGLSGRVSLADNAAMLFIFQDDDIHAFWMKDMLFPIDIIWLSADKRVVFIARNATPESYPLSFVPNVPSRYVLEVPAGFTDRYNVAIGSVAMWE